MARYGRDPVVSALQRKIATAKAAAGLTWEQIAVAMVDCGVQLTASNLMSKQSRCSYKPRELVVLLRLLGLASLEMADIEIAGLDHARQRLTHTS